MSATETSPRMIALPHTDKSRPVQVLQEQLAKEDNVALQPPSTAQPFDPHQFFGVARSSRQEVDAYLAEIRERWQ